MVYSASSPRVRHGVGNLVVGTFIGILSLALPLSLEGQATDREVETVFYMTASEKSFRSFRDHRDRISVVAPQVFSVRGDGVLWGQVDPRVVRLARESGVRLVPLIHNPGFDQGDIHELLTDPGARARAVEGMLTLAREQGFDGWQFDFENIHVSDRDLLTSFYRETAEALHGEGYEISIAVVPTGGLPGARSYHRYMQANWRRSFDLGALAEIGDFISLMTYAQHTGNTPPGPVAGLPWVREMVDHALAQGVPSDRLSLGVPSYSYRWHATEDTDRGIRSTGSGTHFDEAAAILDRLGAVPRWLPEQGTSLVYWENAGTFEWLFLEDRRAFEAKLGLLQEYPGLRGISVWVLGAEDPGIWDVLDKVEIAGH